MLQTITGIFPLFRNLQIFAEGGDGGAGAGAGPAAGDAGAGVSAPDAAVQAQMTSKRKSKQPEQEYVFGQDPGTSSSAVPGAANQPAGQQEKPTDSWEEIKKRYKDEYGRDVQAAIQGRFKGAKQTETSYKQLQSLIAPLLEQRYGIKAGEDGSIDLSALKDAVGRDDDLLADEAAELGLSVETYRQKKASEQRVKELEQEIARRDHDAQMAESFSKHQQQAEAARKFYPNLDLLKEMENPQFTRLLTAGIDVQTAYEVIHRNEVMGGMMGFAAQKAATAISNSIQAGASRPVENGLGNGSAANVTRITDPRQLTKEQRKILRQQVRQGKKIVW